MEAIAYNMIAETATTIDTSIRLMPLCDLILPIH